MLLIAVFSLFLSFVVNPYKFEPLEKEIPIITPVWNWMQESKVSLGLDLQGGTQLDYEIDLRQARELNNDDDPDNDVNIAELIDGVKEVIEKRVNSLGVSEPNIYISSIGDEQHIVVELAGINDISEAKEKVGKVVQLEFKTEKEEAAQEDIGPIKEKAEVFLAKVKKAGAIEDLEAFAEDDLIANKVEYKEDKEKYLDQLPQGIQDVIDELVEGEFYNEALSAKDNDYVVIDQTPVQPEGFNIIRLVESKNELRKQPINAENFIEVLEELGGTSSEKYVREDEIGSEDLTLEITTLDPNQITDVVKDEKGFTIAKLTSKLEATEDDDAQLLISHILLKTEPVVELKIAKPTEEIPEDATEEERQVIEASNQLITEENEQTAKDNEEIAAQNAEAEAKNEDIKTDAEALLAEVIADPSRFAELAIERSEDTGSGEKGGDLGYALPSAYVPEFAEAAKALEVGDITKELVQSQFGYHIIQLNDKKKPEEELFQFAAITICYEGIEGCESTVTEEVAKSQADEVLRRVREETIYTTERVWFNTLPDPWQKTELDARYFRRAAVNFDQTSGRPVVQIEFNEEGGELFAKLTEENINKRMGIFVGGEFISAPNINEKITGGSAQITLGISNVQVAIQQANELARSLNAGSIPAPLKKPNELNIGASLGDESLQKSIQAGMIGLLILAVFMLLYYRMQGLLACCSLIVYGLFLTFLIQSSLPAYLALIITFTLWISFALSLFRSRIDLSSKMLFLSLSIVGVYFIFKVLITPIVLTLAGIAGLILSIGMAVDANILIFERMKEEFKTGKSYVNSVNDGFERAWSSILDSNVSTLITCAILYSFGTSIIQGFSINLAAGVVISMFSAITVTKTFMMIFAGTKIEKIKWLWKRK